MDAESDIFIGKEIPYEYQKLIGYGYIKIKETQIFHSQIENSRIYSEPCEIHEEEWNILSEPVFPLALKSEFFMDKKGNARNNNKTEYRRIYIEPPEYIRHYIENDQIRKRKKTSYEKKSQELRYLLNFPRYRIQHRESAIS